jgi:hypothetical protein
MSTCPDWVSVAVTGVPGVKRPPTTTLLRLTPGGGMNKSGPLASPCAVATCT